MNDEHSAQGRRIPAIADETVTATALHQAIRVRAHTAAGEVLVVVPAPTLSAS